ncbi:MAG: DUF927 domain-containing protein [Rhizobiaceae bacterium]|nr:DUF927 domain-containing protein [Rhizobiaceae bacterium]
MMGLDIDSGYQMEDAFRLVRETGLTCIFYTTHSHLTTRVEIAYDKFYAWATKLGVDPDAPSDSDVRRYMLGEGKYVSAVCNSATFVEKAQANGMKIVVETTPIPKFRMVFPLAKPFIYKAQLGAHKDVISLWSRKVLGLGRQFGVEPDNAARDPSRLFYLPRHRKGSTGHRIMLTIGKLIRFEDIPEGTPHAKQSNDPFEKAGAAMGATKGGDDRLKSPELGIDLMTWAAQRAHGFDIAQVFKDHADDRIREEHSESKYAVECPFDEGHSDPGNPDDRACFVESAGHAETFAFSCRHEGCAGYDRLHFMRKCLADSWFPESVLTDPDYYVCEIEDDAGSESAGDPSDKAAPGVGKPCVDLRGTGFKYNPKDDPNWIVTTGKDGDPVCQPFEVVEHYEDAFGDNATLVLRFESMGRTKTCEMKRSDPWTGRAAIEKLANMNFRLSGDGTAALELLRKLLPPVTGRWMDRRGWHDGAFLTVGGETIKAEGSAVLPMRMLDTTRKPLAPAGTLEGWKEAVAPVWNDNASGREHFALALMMGMAGPVSGLCHPEGFRMLAFHGPSSRGKSLACKLMASISGPALSVCYKILRATDNGVEAVLPDVSHHAIALDEGQHMKADHLNSLVFMLEAGTGKTTATRDRGAREVKNFGGLAMLANEKPLAQKLKDADVDVSPGFDARVLDINVASVKDYPKGEATPLTTKLYGIERHNGHALRIVVKALLGMDPERIKKQVERLTTALVGADAGGLESRAMETLAWVWFGGILGKKLDLIPADFSIGKVMRWARQNRVADASKPVSERVLSTLRTSIARRRRVDLYTWEKSEFAKGSDDIEEGYKGAAGYFYKARNGEELIILADALRGMAGNICSETEIAQYLRDGDFLRMSGKNLYHDTLPMRDGTAERVKNYRVVSAFYLDDGKNEPESSADVAA